MDKVCKTHFIKKMVCQNHKEAIKALGFGTEKSSLSLARKQLPTR
jgi:hypothetical protein